MLSRALLTLALAGALSCKRAPEPADAGAPSVSATPATTAAGTDDGADASPVNAPPPEEASDASSPYPNVPVAEARPGFRKASLEPATLAKIFAQVPELARIGTDLRYFTEGDVRAMVSRGSGDREGITFQTAPLYWSPESGAELLVAAGRGKTMSFVVALWTLPNDTYRFGSAFLMQNDLSPVALAYDPSHRKELRWTSCWGCNGEQGFVSYRPEDHRVVIVQQ